MELYIGGYAQGKLAYVQKKYLPGRRAVETGFSIISIFG